MQNYVQEKQQAIKLLYSGGLESDFIPWESGQQGQQTYLKLRREEEVAFLYAGVGGVLEAELQKTIMRLVNDGWMVQGEVNLTFDGARDLEADAPFAPDACLLELGSSLLPLVDPYQNAPLLQRFPTLRQEIAEDIGFVTPSFKVADNMSLQPSSYRIRLRGTLVASGEVFLDRYLALGSLEQLGKLTGWTTTDPSYRLPAKWIEPDQREGAEAAGCMVLGALGVLLTHVREVIKAHASLLLGLQETHALVSRLQQSHPIVVSEFLERIDRLRKLRRILQRLLGEGVSIRDLVTILEEVGDHLAELDALKSSKVEAVVNDITEDVRKALARQITSVFVDDSGALRAMVLSDAAEEHLARELEGNGKASKVALAELEGDPLLRGVREALEEYHHPAVLFTAPTLRLHVRQRLERAFPTLAVLSVAEMPPGLHVEVAGQVKWLHKSAPRADSTAAVATAEADSAGFWKSRKKKKP